jgi:prefoldin subunit 5
VSERERITIGELSADAGDAVAGTPVRLPVVDVLTGRGFVTGKSGSGKSNTASVVIEELLDSGYPVLIVDTDGEYYGLKEEYELLHAGADEECDIQIGPAHAERIATLALEENVPIILDVSGYLDEGIADELLRETARHLFTKEKKLKKPFLLVVEEVHEYLPQKGGGGETGKMLIKIGKRGRKHGLGIMGISQRPADVKKDFITQANWLVWHRLTWDNDTKVVGRVVDSEYQELVADLGDGEAFVQTDWTEVDVRRIQFRRKRTFDAGATPGLGDFERPELKSISESLMDDLAELSEEEEERSSELADMQQELDKKRSRIDQLESELDQARDVSNAARQLANAFSRGDVAMTPEDVEARLAAKDDRIEELEAQIDDLQTELEDAHQHIAELETENQRLRDATATIDFDDGEESVVQTAFADSEPADSDDSPIDLPDPPEETASLGEREVESAPTDRPDGQKQALADENDADSDVSVSETIDRLHREPIVSEIEAAATQVPVGNDDCWQIVETIATDGPVAVAQIESATEVPVQYVWTFLSELRERPFITRDRTGLYRLEQDVLEREIASVAEQDTLEELLHRFED